MVQKATKPDSPPDVDDVIASLKRSATKKTLAGMARYGIASDKALGVAMSDIQKLAKQTGKSHALALELWKTDIYEARLLAAYVDDPAEVTAPQMQRWCQEFDNWAVCDTLCFALFDRTTHAWKKVTQWSKSRDEFVKRAAFALLWGLTVHDKEADNDTFMQGLELIEKAADDERHFVKKAVNMALRAVGKRNRALNVAAIAVAQQLATANSASAQWIGKDALRELKSASVAKRIASRT